MRKSFFLPFYLLNRLLFGQQLRVQSPLHQTPVSFMGIEDCISTAASSPLYLVVVKCLYPFLKHSATPFTPGFPDYHKRVLKKYKESAFSNFVEAL
jgi:hypothetical protein